MFSKQKKILGAVYLIIFLIWYCSAIIIKYYAVGEISRIKLAVCVDDNKLKHDCEFIGYVAQRPFMPEVKVKTIPLYPVLNCPSSVKDCKQQIFYVARQNIKSISDVDLE